MKIMKCAGIAASLACAGVRPTPSTSISIRRMTWPGPGWDRAVTSMGAIPAEGVRQLGSTLPSKQQTRHRLNMLSVQLSTLVL